MEASITRPRSSVTALVAARAAIASRPATTRARHANTAPIPAIILATSPSDAVPDTTGERAAEISRAWASTSRAVIVPRSAVSAMGPRAERA